MKLTDRSITSGLKRNDDPRRNWKEAYGELRQEIIKLGYPEEFGYMIAKNLGSPKAIRRMSSYLRQVKPRKPEMIADEMLAIMSEIENWKRKKKAEEANAAYNELLLRGLDEESDI